MFKKIFRKKKHDCKNCEIICCDSYFQIILESTQRFNGFSKYTYNALSIGNFYRKAFNLKFKSAF